VALPVPSCFRISLFPLELAMTAYPIVAKKYVHLSCKLHSSPFDRLRTSHSAIPRQPFDNPSTGSGLGSSRGSGRSFSDPPGNGYSSSICALIISMSCGVTSAMPCSFAWALAFINSSSSVSPRTTWLHPVAGFTLPQSIFFPTIVPPRKRFLGDSGTALPLERGLHSSNWLGRRAETHSTELRVNRKHRGALEAHPVLPKWRVHITTTE